MPYVDHIAAEQLCEWRDNAGLSNEGLANAIKLKAKEKGWVKVHGAVDAFTIRRILEQGHRPSPRVRLVIALYFGTQPNKVWKPENRQIVQSESPKRVTA